MRKDRRSCTSGCLGATPNGPGPETGAVRLSRQRHARPIQAFGLAVAHAAGADGRNAMASPAEIPPSTVLLRSGSNGLSCHQVAEIQRSRILTATVDAVEQLGYARLTVAEIIGRARISRKTFYDVFSDREDCFLAAFEQALAEASLLARTACSQGPSWRNGMRLALARLLQFMEDEPRLARLCLVEALGAGDRVRARRMEVVAEIARVIDRGRLANSPSGEPSEIAAEGIVGAIVTVLHNRLLERDEKPLIELLGPLMSIIVLPYHGPSAAKRELRRPTPPVSRGRVTHVPAQDPLQGLNIRLTYRTVRVLMVIAEHPGASNRGVAEASGIIDQVQISKLLTRLAGLELVENRGLGQQKGAANAWHLTARGGLVERATRPRRWRDMLTVARHRGSQHLPERLLDHGVRDRELSSLGCCCLVQRHDDARAGDRSLQRCARDRPQLHRHRPALQRRRHGVRQRQDVHSTRAAG